MIWSLGWVFAFVSGVLDSDGLLLDQHLTSNIDGAVTEPGAAMFQFQILDKRHVFRFSVCGAS